MLLHELRDFVESHGLCGKLSAETSDPIPNGYLLTVSCPCGVVFMRWVTPDAAAYDIVSAAMLRHAN
jgi:hypothetical protein